MTHPITPPPPELAAQWVHEIYGNRGTVIPLQTCTLEVIERAAQWGADQQLAKDAKWLDSNALHKPHLKITPVGESLKEAMRPKPLSLREQALWELVNAYNLDQIDDSTYDTIHKALKVLPND